jgi:hypothetical protein
MATVFVQGLAMLYLALLVSSVPAHASEARPQQSAVLDAAGSCEDSIALVRNSIRREIGDLLRKLCCKRLGRTFTMSSGVSSGTELALPAKAVA